MNSNKEFLDLLNTIAEEKKFTETLTDGKEYNFKPINTSQLKGLVKSLVDSPLTQTIFNNTLTQIFNECLLDKTERQFNIIDRTLFYLGARVNALDSKYNLVSDNGEEIVDLKECKETLLKNCLSLKLEQTKTHEAENFGIEYGIPLITTEYQFNQELYNRENFDTDLDEPEELRNFIGDLFINEISKCVQRIKIGDKQMELNSLSFSERNEIIEKLPVVSMSAVISFIETYKNAIREVFTTENETPIPLDGTLFSLGWSDK